MMLIILTLLSAFIYSPFLPEWVEIFTTPKDFALSIMSTVCALTLYSKSQKEGYGTFPLLLPVCIYAGLCLLSVKNAVSSGLVLRQVGFDLMGFVFFWTTINFIKPHRMESVVRVVVLIAVVSAALALAGKNISQPYGGLFGNPEYAAGITTLAVGASVWMWSFLTFTLLAHLFFAQARSAMIGLVVGLMVVLWARGLIKHLVVVVGAVATVGILAVSGVGSDYLQRHHLGQWGTGSISTDRRHIYSMAGAYALKYPVFGIGRGNFQLHSYQFVYTGGGAVLPQKNYFTRLHNDYLQLWLEAGPVALGVFLFILWRLLWPIPAGLLGSGLFIGLLAEAFRGLFLFPFQLGPDVAYFWIMAGLYWVVKKGQ